MQAALAKDHSSENSEEDENLPEGVTYSLNLKRLVVGQLRRLATMLELLCEGTKATLRQVIEGKLVELDYEPRNIQVIVANEDSRLFLVNESGIVKEERYHVSASINTHMHTEPNVTINNEHAEEIDTLSRQLHEVHLEIEGLRNKMNMCDETLAALRIELDTADDSLRAGDESCAKIERLQEALKLQTTKAKIFWSQKCK